MQLVSCYTPYQADYKIVLKDFFCLKYFHRIKIFSFLLHLPLKLPVVRATDALGT